MTQWREEKKKQIIESLISMFTQVWLAFLQERSTATNTQIYDANMLIYMYFEM